MGWELDAVNTTVVGDVTGKAVETWLNEQNQICFVMQDEPVTVTAAAKTWETDPRVNITIENGHSDGKRSLKVFQDVGFQLTPDEAPEGMIFDR